MLRFFNIINAAFVAATIVAYAVGYGPILGSGYALYFQFFLGIYQLIFALILSCSYKKFDRRSASLMGYYWLSVVTFVLLLCSLRFIPNEIIAFIIIMIPMMIACYQVYAIYKISQQLNNPS